MTHDGVDEHARASRTPPSPGTRTSLENDRRALLERFELVDVAFKVVGVGSVGTRCFVALFMSDIGDPLFLQVKEAGTSVCGALCARAGAPVRGGRRSAPAPAGPSPVPGAGAWWAGNGSCRRPATSSSAGPPSVGPTTTSASCAT